MKKVQDINALGVVQHQIGYSGEGDLRDVLIAGLLGGTMDAPKDLKERKESWVEWQRTKENSQRPSVLVHKINKETPPREMKGLIVDISGYRMVDETNKINPNKTRTVREWNFFDGTQEVYSRIPPRLFRGIFIWSEGESEWGRKATREKVGGVVTTMLDVFKDRANLLLPIYDLVGNLLWPKQMSYEEVKKFVAERDKNAGTEETNFGTAN